jgi:hypothetical protein
MLFFSRSLENKMIKEAYQYVDVKEGKLFVFQSEGPQGLIVKIVQFTHEGNDIWNLGFGDLDNGGINDNIVTNNHDAMRVIRTVAKITLEFFEKYPSCTIKIRPVDEKRKKLYNIVFKRHFKDIEPIFDVIGSRLGKYETYLPLKYYDKFQLKLK